MTEEEQLEKAREIFERMRDARIKWDKLHDREIQLSLQTSVFATTAERARANEELSKIRPEVATARALWDNTFQQLMAVLELDSDDPGSANAPPPRARVPAPSPPTAETGARYSFKHLRATPSGIGVASPADFLNADVARGDLAAELQTAEVRVATARIEVGRALDHGLRAARHSVEELHAAREAAAKIQGALDTAQRELERLAKELRL